MSVPIAAVAAGAAAAGLVAGPFLQRVIDRSPPDPDDDPAPVPKVGPWLGRTRLLGVVLAALNAGMVLGRGVEASLPAFIVFVACLVTVSVIDLDLFLIPNRVVYPSLFAIAALLVAAAAIDGHADPLRTAAIGGLGAWASATCVLPG